MTLCNFGTMLLILHGDDTAASRNYLQELKEKYPEATSFDGEKVTLTDLTQVLEGGGLFTEEKQVFIELFFAKKKNTSDYDVILAYLKQQGKSSEIILWENKELDRRTVMGLKEAQVRPFKLPQVLFTFLDNIKPGNGKMLIKLFHQTITTTEPELLFFMLTKQIRTLLALKENAQIDEVKKMADWQRGKLQSQAKTFSTQQLVELHKKLYKIDLATKTGSLPTSFISAIDFFLLGI